MFQRGCNHQPGTIYTDSNSLDTHSQTRDESRCLTNLWVVPVFFTWASVLLPASPSASHFVVFFYYLRNIQQKLAYNKLKFHVPRLFVDTSIFLGSTVQTVVQCCPQVLSKKQPEIPLDLVPGGPGMHDALVRTPGSAATLQSPGPWTLMDVRIRETNGPIF